MDNGKYPDLLPDDGLFLKAEVPGLLKNAPPIRWGAAYLVRPVDEKVAYLEKLAATLNHALNLMQQDRNRLSETAFAQEAQIRQLVAARQEQGEMMQRQLTRENSEKDRRLQEVVALRARVRELERVG